jgi:predicted dinucleotide-binding enzyme
MSQPHPIAIIGVGKIGGAIARHLTTGGEQVVLAARDESDAAALAQTLGGRASSAPVVEAIKAADVVVFAVWADVMRQLIGEYRDLLGGRVVVDPTNPIGLTAEGKPFRTLPEAQSQASLVAAMLPPGAHYVKAFGSVLAASLADGANRAPRRVVLFYATDDDRAATVAERLITVSGFDPVKVGGVSQAGRIEAGGDLVQTGGLNGQLLDADQAQAAIMAA